jgi:hypothetical protein
MAKENCMRLTWITFGSLRRPALAGLVLAIAFVFGAASGSFAQAATQEQAAPAKPALAFQHDAGLIIFYIKPDKTADFEDLMNKLKDGLAKMDAPEAKQQAAGMKLFKNTAANSQVAVYMLVADPVVKDVEYWFLPVLYKAYPNDGQALLEKWKGCKADTPAAPGLFDLAQVVKFQ